jgi:hypothetical protein
VHHAPSRGVYPRALVAPRKRGHGTRRINKTTGLRAFYTRYDPDGLKDAAVPDIVLKAVFRRAERDPAKMKRAG